MCSVKNTKKRSGCLLQLRRSAGFLRGSSEFDYFRVFPLGCKEEGYAPSVFVLWATPTAVQSFCSPRPNQRVQFRNSRCLRCSNFRSLPLAAKRNRRDHELLLGRSVAVEHYFLVLLLLFLFVVILYSCHGCQMKWVVD